MQPKQKPPEPKTPAPEPIVTETTAVEAKPVNEEESGLTVKIEEGNRPDIDLNAFVEKLLADRNKPEPVYVPPAPHPRQLEQTRLEMEAGAKRVAENEAEQRPVHPRDPSEGTSTPVYRPVEFVPNMNQGTKVGARQV